MPINATFGTVEYKENGVIAVPVTFAENVFAPSKTVFPITQVSGNALTDVEYTLVGQNTAFQLIFEMPLNRKGEFRISGNGSVLKASGTWDTVTATALDVPYSTIVPELVDHRLDRRDGRIDVILQYNTDCTINDPETEFGDDAQFADFLDYAGTNLDPPNFYRKVNNDYPDIPIPVFEDVSGNSDWTQDDLKTEDATIYLLRWGNVAEDVDFNVTVKPGFVRGPVR